MPARTRSFLGLLALSPLLSQTPTTLNEDDQALNALIELLNTPVTVASNVMTDRNKQPVSVTTVSRDQIELSGARSLMEVLNAYVPGFFHVEDQDDNIAGFRGIAPDSNSKVMFLINGHVLNTEWFWGPPDALLQGIDLGYIERIDVIRGPGSVTLGQGALLGVINIVTRAGFHRGQSLAGRLGKDGAYGVAYDGGFTEGRMQAYVHLSRQTYDGQQLRAEGNATRDWEGILGGKLFNGGDRLKRAQNTTGLVNLSSGAFALDFLHADQKRDVYNFRRDRNQYDQVLDSLNAHYTFRVSEDHSVKIKAGLEQDDYILSSNLGYRMGGTREYRQSALVLYNGAFGDFRLAAGAEFKRFQMGRRNRDDNNFIVNQAGPGLLNVPNRNNQWVYPKDINVHSGFAEGFWSPDPAWDVFGALRYDKHPFWGSNVTPRMGLLFSPQKEWNFRLSFQTGFRGAPGVHYAGGFQGDGLLREENFSLVNAATAGKWTNLEKVEPERTASLELQAVWSPSKSLKADVVLFRNKVDHVIGFAAFGSWLFTPVPNTIGSDQKGDWDGYWYFQNTKGSFNAQGLEATLRWHQTFLDLNISHALVKLGNVDAEAHDSLYITPTALGDHFKGYPEQVTRVNAVFFPLAALTGSLQLLNYGDWYTGGPKGQGQLLVNGALRAKASANLTLVLSVTNLFNAAKLYPFTDGPGGNQTDPRPGVPSVEARTWWFKVGYTF